MRKFAATLLGSLSAALGVMSPPRTALVFVALSGCARAQLEISAENLLGTWVESETPKSLRDKRSAAQVWTVRHLHGDGTIEVHSYSSHMAGVDLGDDAPKFWSIAGNVLSICSQRNGTSGECSRYAISRLTSTSLRFDGEDLSETTIWRRE